MHQVEPIRFWPVNSSNLSVIAIWIVTKQTRESKSKLWWKQEIAQRTWIEITGRVEIGSDIRHNKKQARQLLAIARKGDKVIHWDTNRKCFVGISIISDSKPRRIGNDIGLLLSDFRQFPKGNLTLEQIREQWKLVKEIHDECAVPGESLYFPFAPHSSGGWKTLRPRQTYLAIAPPSLVNVLGAIYKQHAEPHTSPPWEAFELSTGFLPKITKAKPKPLVKYSKAKEEQNTIAKSWLTTNEALAKGTAGHNKLQNSLATWLIRNGYKPDPTRAMEKLIVDLKWRNGNTLCVCEVKTLGKEESNQLRLGLGQVLSYRFETDKIEGKRVGIKVKAVLAIDREPSKENLQLWEGLCSELGVLLIWPREFGRVKNFMS